MSILSILPRSELMFCPLLVRIIARPAIPCSRVQKTVGAKL